MNEFNNDQIEVIKEALKNQEDVWSKTISDRQYYDADLKLLNETLNLIKKEKRKIIK
jgi:hypothetical protein